MCYRKFKYYRWNANMGSNVMSHVRYIFSRLYLWHVGDIQSQVSTISRYISKCFLWMASYMDTILPYVAIFHCFIDWHLDKWPSPEFWSDLSCYNDLVIWFSIAQKYTLPCFSYSLLGPCKLTKRMLYKLFLVSVLSNVGHIHTSFT